MWITAYEQKHDVNFRQEKISTLKQTIHIFVHFLAAHPTQSQYAIRDQSIGNSFLTVITASPTHVIDIWFTLYVSPMAHHPVEPASQLRTERLVSIRLLSPITIGAYGRNSNNNKIQLNEINSPNLIIGASAPHMVIRLLARQEGKVYQPFRFDENVSILLYVSVINPFDIISVQLFPLDKNANSTIISVEIFLFVRWIIEISPLFIPFWPQNINIYKWINVCRWWPTSRTCQASSEISERKAIWTMKKCFLYQKKEDLFQNEDTQHQKKKK